MRGFDRPVVTNLAANRQLLAATLGIAPDQLPTAYRERCQNYRNVELAGDAPWQDVVLEGDDCWSVWVGTKVVNEQMRGGWQRQS